MNAHTFTAFRPKLSIVIVAIALAVMLVAAAGTTFAAGAVPQTSDVFRFDDGSDVGNAQLVRTNSSVWMRINSSPEGELLDFESGVFLEEFYARGDATTNWWVIFNNPENCTAPCGADDIFSSLGGDLLDIQVDIIFATGHVAGQRWQAGAHLSEGDTTGSLLPDFFGLDAIGLNDAMKAEIHLIVRSHGPAENFTPEELAAAISTVDGGCTLVDGDGLNTCGDAQFAIFLAP